MKITSLEFKVLLETANSIRHVQELLDISWYTYHRYVKLCDYGYLHLLLKERGLNRSYTLTKLSDEEIFCKGIKRSSSVLRPRLQKLLPYICSECGQEPWWNGKPLTLPVDHIDGDNCNNELNNLRFLCLHCHSQTETYGSKNADMAKNRKEYFCNCGARMFKNSRQCLACSKNTTVRKRKFEVSKEELEDLFKKLPVTKIGVLYGVSDNAIRKRAKLLGVDIPKYPPGYWL